ncbi:MAG: hypothetical protein HXX13_00475 [Bacteroidetes bacterium]|nr:hypothetical protein [Bacteroidota bacterium]
MKAINLSILVISLILLSLTSAAQTKIEKEWDMKQYFMVFLSKGPNRSQDSITAAKIQEAHLNNISRLFEEKKLVLAGPFLDDGEVMGIFILDVPTVEEARKVTETDPAVQAGRLKMEIRPWYGPGSIIVGGKN